MTNLTDEGLKKVSASFFAGHRLHERLGLAVHLENEFFAILEQVRDAAKKEEQDRCCSIVFGQCSSDNVAQRTVTAIRQMEVK